MGAHLMMDEGLKAGDGSMCSSRPSHDGRRIFVCALLAMALLVSCMLSLSLSLFPAAREADLTLALSRPFPPHQLLSSEDGGRWL